MADTLKIASVNCQGLSTPSKRKDVLNYYKNTNFSIICLQEGEKPTKYFCNLESRNYVNKTIQKLEAEGQGTIREQETILKEIKKNYYHKLYSNIDDNLLDVDLSDTLSSYNVPKLEEHMRESLEYPVSEAEIIEVLKNMKNNKSPGSDGYTAEFFKFFWNDLKSFIVRAVNDVFVNKKVSYFSETRYNHLLAKRRQTKAVY